MAKKDRITEVIKNRQETFSPFLHFDNSSVLHTYQFKSTEIKEREKQIRAKKKAKRKKIFNTIIFLLNIAILAAILLVQLSTEDVNTVISPKIEWKYIAIIAGIVFLLILIDALKIYILIRKATKKSRPFLAYKTSALGRYYDNITPMNTGGQPFQMLYMNKRGVRGDIATGIPLMKYIMFQISYVIICTFVLIYGSVNAGAINAFAIVLAWIAVLFNLIVFLTIILLSVSKKFGPKVVIWVLKLLAKMHIIKNYQKTFRKVMRFVVNYQKTFKMFVTNPFVLFVEFFLASADIIIVNFIPYFICLAFVPGASISFFGTFTLSVICGLSVGFIPTPGASGGAEGLFMLVFAGIFTDGLFWPVLVWRIATYYVYLLQGLLVLVYDFVVGNKKAERLNAQGAEVGAYKKQTFRETLESNIKTIEAISKQEQDKIAVQTFYPIDELLHTYEESDEIIKDSDLVSKEEMNQKVYTAEQALLQVKTRELNKKKSNNKKFVKKSKHRKFRRIIK